MTAGSDEGFTLIETLIAFLVLSLSLGLIAQSVSNATSVIRRADQLDAARTEAGRLLAEAGEGGGGTIDGEGLNWTLSRRRIERNDGSGTGLPPVDITIVEIRREGASDPLYVLRSATIGKEAP